MKTNPVDVISDWARDLFNRGHVLQTSVDRNTLVFTSFIMGSVYPVFWADTH